MFSFKLFMSFHESYKFIGNGRKIWNSVILTSSIFYIANNVLTTIYDDKNDENKKISDTTEDFTTESSNYEKLLLATTVIHTFWLHIMPNLTVAFLVKYYS